VIITRKSPILRSTGDGFKSYLRQRYKLERVDYSLYREGEEIPEKVKIALVVSRNGDLYLRGNLSMFGIPVLTLSFNLEQFSNGEGGYIIDRTIVAEESTLHVPKISTEWYKRVLSFFHEVYRLYDSEAALILLWNYFTHEWGFVAPAQQVINHVSVDYKYPTDPPPNGWIYVGAFHSHADFSAFFSSDDDESDFKIGGFFVTVGDGGLTVVASLVMEGWRFIFPARDLIQFEEPLFFPNWMEGIRYLPPPPIMAHAASNVIKKPLVVVRRVPRKRK
jgi:hypothetical protein